MARLLTLQFVFIQFLFESLFFCFKNLILPAERIVLKTKNGNETKVASLLTLQALKCGQVIDSTAYVYVYLLIDLRGHAAHGEMGGSRDLHPSTFTNA